MLAFKVCIRLFSPEAGEFGGDSAGRNLWGIGAERDPYPLPRAWDLFLPGTLGQGGQAWGPMHGLLWSPQLAGILESWGGIVSAGPRLSLRAGVSWADELAGLGLGGILHSGLGEGSRWTWAGATPKGFLAAAPCLAHLPRGFGPVVSLLWVSGCTSVRRGRVDLAALLCSGLCRSQHSRVPATAEVRGEPA